ncbi:MAG: HlyD family type I secretion periplasmic adaptor subunit [Xanthobacteraceae bacterium]
MSPDQTAAATIRQFQSETDAIREAPEPLALRVTVFILAGMFVCAIAVMSLTKVDRVVTSLAGKIVPTEQVNVFQALDASIIKSIDVREGDQVTEGQLLATLDPTFAAADFQQSALQVASLEAQVARAEAELADREFVVAEKSDPNRQRYYSLQKGLYDQRIAQYAAQINSFDAKIKQTEATIQKLEGDAGRYQQREQIAKRIEDMRTTLAEHGTGTQLNMLASQDQRLEMLRTIENGQNSLLEQRQTLRSLKADREAFIQQWYSALSQELVKARNDLDTARAAAEKASRHNDLVRLTAAEPSVVLTVARVSVGSVLREGDQIFTLMPLRTPVEAEIHIASRDVGFVRPGDRCIIKIDAFNYTEHGIAEGDVRWISEGAFTTDDNNQPTDTYYKARCAVTATNFIQVPKNFRLIPGMTLEADLKVGTRSVAMYLLGGMLKGFNTSMREP